MLKAIDKPRIIGDIELYDVPQIAEILKLAPFTVTKFFREGKFPRVKIGRSYYLSRENLFKFIREGKIILAFDKNLSFVEIKSKEKDLMENTEKNLRIAEHYLEIMKLQGTPAEAQKIMQERYDKAKADLEDYKKEPINLNDMKEI